MNLFVYGTLLFPEIRALVGGREFQFQPAYLKGYRVLKVQGATFPGVIKTGFETDMAQGEILFDLNEAELARFDAYEDTFYVRETVEAMPEQDRTRYGPNRTGYDLAISAMIYVVPNELAGQILTDEQWTRQWFDDHHREEFFRRIGG